MNIDELTGTGLERGYGLRSSLPGLLAENAGMSGYRDLLGSLAKRTACVTLLAGAGSRWVRSLEEARARKLAQSLEEGAPRGLYPVANHLGRGPDPVPIAAYALDAVRGLGRQAVVLRGWEREIDERIRRPLGFEEGSWTYIEQDAPGGKPRGHGDAAWQTVPFWGAYDYVIFNFGGDASSPATAALALGMLDALAQDTDTALSCGLLLPVTRVAQPAYPVTLDARGLPLSFGHAKLKGQASAEAGQAKGPGGLSYANVGLRLYKASALLEALETIRRDYWTPQGGYAIPGNDPAGGEFALDNADAWLAERGKARLAWLASPAELSPVKEFGDLVRFEADVRAVSAEARSLGF